MTAGGTFSQDDGNLTGGGRAAPGGRSASSWRCTRRSTYRRYVKKYDCSDMLGCLPWIIRLAQMFWQVVLFYRVAAAHLDAHSAGRRNRAARDGGRGAGVLSQIGRHPGRDSRCCLLNFLPRIVLVHPRLNVARHRSPCLGEHRAGTLNISHPLQSRPKRRRAPLLLIAPVLCLLHSVQQTRPVVLNL